MEIEKRTIMEHHGHGAIDPVCGMTVDPATAKHKADHKGHDVLFLLGGLQDKVRGQSGKISGRIAKAAEPVAAGTIYTCPMHPEIRQEGPGSCPICGMALEPLTVTAESGPNHELIDMTRRFWIGLVLAVPVVVLEMGGHMTGLTMMLGQQLSNWLQFAARNAGCCLGGVAVFRARLAVAAHAQSQHVHADRARHGRCLGLQRHRNFRAADIPRGIPPDGWLGCGLFRSGGGHHGACSAWAGA